MTRDPEGTLMEIGKMGYKFVETAGYAGKTVDEFALLLKKAGLKASGMHVGFGDCESKLDQVLHEADVLKCPYIICPGIGSDVYGPGWDKAGLRLQAIGEKVVKAKKQFGYHNHSFEFEMVNGKTGYEILFDAACPDYLFNEIDLWWAHCGKQDVPKILGKYGARVKCVHLKDGLKCDEGTHMEAGKGVMPWDSILAACKKARVDFGVVELDSSPRAPLESVRACLEFYRSKGFKA